MDAAQVLAAADRLLRRRHGWTVAEDGSATALEGSRRSLVQRVPLEGPDGPGSVIVKAYRSSFDAFLNEAAATDFLGSHPALRSFGPRLVTADPDVPLVVLEDLGSHPSLADALLGTDRYHAASALLEWARSLGTLHAATLGRRPEFEQRRVSAAGRRSLPPPERSSRSELVAGVDRLCGLGVARPALLDREVEAVAALEHVGELDAFTPSDTCPDNNIFTPGGLRFFDFEGAGFRHAFLDAAYIRIAFPTCWCVNRLPPDLVLRMEETYREELGHVAPEVADAAFYSDHMARACAWWLLITSGWLLSPLLERDAPVGPPGRQPATRRQCVVHRLELFREVAEELDALPGLAGLAAGGARQLRRRWPGADCDLPVYPPFR